MAHPAPGKARLLDLSRLVSRVGRGAWTGIDRVEAAYLQRLLKEDVPLFALVGSSFGFTLFDRRGTEALADRLLGRAEWGEADLVSRLFLKAHPLKRQAEADLRRMCLGRSGRRGLPALLKAHLPDGPTWVNVGHSNLRASVFDAVHALRGRAVVMVHDTIPLDHPEWQREGTVEGFRSRMSQVARKADLVVHTAEATRRMTEAQFAQLERVPDAIVAHLGITVRKPEPDSLSQGLRLNRPYFVVLGTIEPRKNHALLLDVWAELATQIASDEMPRLLIVGARGWNNEEVFARLDARPAHVQELGTLNDGALAALLTGARALLMPSLVEGFGLPPGEALALGCPVIASDLPVYREVFGNNLVYLDPRDMYSWVSKTRHFARNEYEAQAGTIPLPDWDSHFNRVLKCL
ncbi:glycosyltransferase family 1 protein [uncultured Maritimibacter sp.]|uniref:glycosyltransferase family 4 protein n=1 Tax=uncultured Maritimibacter sp. TaxID=991866 RepID=UPI000C09B422|nr:glycosyl transferase [Maritimibacter sp.]